VIVPVNLTRSLMNLISLSLVMVWLWNILVEVGMGIRGTDELRSFCFWIFFRINVFF